MGAQHDRVLRRLHPEGVLHGAGGVVGPEVQGVEVQPLRLDQRPFGHLPPHRHEDVCDPLRQRRDGVAGSRGPPVGRNGDVDRLLHEDACLLLLLQHDQPIGDGSRDVTTCLTDALTGLLARLRWQGADLTVRQRQRRTIPGVREARLLQRRQVVGRGDGVQGLVRARATSDGDSAVTSTGSYSVFGPDICAPLPLAVLRPRTGTQPSV